MIESLTRATLELRPLPSVEAGEKGSHGQILIIAGSRAVPGAALLAAHGAMRAGAGKLQIATVASVAPQLGVAMPEAMVLGMPEDDEGGFANEALSTLLEHASTADAILAGPGLTNNAVGGHLAAGLVCLERPLALDAALLHSLAANPSQKKRISPVLLPHAGEMASLLNRKSEEIETNALAAGLDCAKLYDAITLMKGVESHVVAPDGRAWLYKGGGPGLGISGSGDVLAGIVGGLMARGADPLTALLWGVWLHGEAGRRLGQKIGSRGFLARQLPEEIPELLYKQHNR